MTVTLFHGLMGWAIGTLAIFGGAVILTSAQNWLYERVEVSLRHAAIRVRWDRPGALVDMGDGRQGAIMNVFYRDGGCGAPRMALIQPYEDECQRPCEWIPLDHVTPLPAGGPA
jgi:hypothetical protein